MKLLTLFNISFLIAVAAISGTVDAKECTNTPTYLSSHTLRSQLLSSRNASFQPPSIAGGGGGEEHFCLDELYREIKKSGDGGRVDAGKHLREVSLHDVRLDPASMQGTAQEANLEYLLLLEVDRLVWSFRKTANLSTPGLPYGGWEKPSGELRGHFVGHYLSGSALMWASTHNQTLYDNMQAVVSALDACQKKMGTGYLSAFPSEQFDRFEAIQPVWAPYYTIHKIMAGLLDQYTLAGNEQALQMVIWMAEYFCNRVQNVIVKYSLERHWMSLNEETGGMNDVLYRLYSITGNQKHLVLAHLFDKPCFLGLLAVQADSLSGFHANTHIPVVIGSQMRYDITGDPLYKAIATFFMSIINSSHSYASGGTSVSEFWYDPKRLANTLQTENQESCTTYNMLKVSRHLFRWTKEMAYADYYERALTNGVLSIQRGREPGVMIYMLPQGRGVSKARSHHGWGTQFNSFWCCYGTGIESFSKLGDSIYFEGCDNVPALYVIQFISSSLNWKSGQVIITQKVKPVVSWDPYLCVSFSFSMKEQADQVSTLYLRIPFWTYSEGAKATSNGQKLPVPPPGNFLSITRKWRSSDTLTLELPINLRTEPIKDDRPQYASLQAILFGPYLLAGLTNGDWDVKSGPFKSLSDWIRAIPSTYNCQLVSLTQLSNGKTLMLANSNNSITMEELPKSGTDAAVHGTFRLVSKSTNVSCHSSRMDILGKSFMLEPFDLPELLVQRGSNDSLVVSTTTREGMGLGGDKHASIFRVVAGLDGMDSSVSLELENQQGCYVYAGFNYNAGKIVQIICRSEMADSDSEFSQATSFKLNKGIMEYHPISFVANGERRNFLLMPLLHMRDESYTVYLNVGSSITMGSDESQARQVV